MSPQWRRQVANIFVEVVGRRTGKDQRCWNDAHSMGRWVRNGEDLGTVVTQNCWSAQTPRHQPVQHLSVIGLGPSNSGKWRRWLFIILFDSNSSHCRKLQQHKDFLSVKVPRESNVPKQIILITPFSFLTLLAQCLRGYCDWLYLLTMCLSIYLSIFSGFSKRNWNSGSFTMADKWHPVTFHELNSFQQCLNTLHFFILPLNTTNYQQNVFYKACTGHCKVQDCKEFTATWVVSWAAALRPKNSN